MGQPVLTSAAIVMCVHGAQAAVWNSAARVRIAGSSVLCTSDAATLSACPAQPPCLALHLAGANRVFASGRALAIGVSPLQHRPTSQGLVVHTQERVRVI